MVQKIDTIKTMDGIFDKLENRMEGDSGMWGPKIDE